MAGCPNSEEDEVFRYEVREPMAKVKLLGEPANASKKSKRSVIVTGKDLGKIGNTHRLGSICQRQRRQIRHLDKGDCFQFNS